MKIKITPRQKKFADYYLQTANLYQSAKKAGYSDSYSKARSHELLENIGIKQYLESRMDKMDKKRIATIEEVLEFLTRVMRGEENDQFGIEVSIQDRTKAGELLLKRYRAFDKIDEKMDKLKRKQAELDVQKKQIELDKLSGKRDGDKDVLSAIDKLSKRVEDDIK